LEWPGNYGAETCERGCVAMGAAQADSSANAGAIWGR